MDTARSCHRLLSVSLGGEKYTYTLAWAPQKVLIELYEKINNDAFERLIKNSLIGEVRLE